MYLKQVSLTNFRCFDSLTIELHPRLTVLVAENGGGKTAILDAIARGLSPVLRFLSSANQRLSGAGVQDVDIRLKNNRACDYTRIYLAATAFSGELEWDVTKAASHQNQMDQKTGHKQIADYAAALLGKVDEHDQRLLPVFAYYGARRGSIEIPSRLRIPRKKNVNYDYPTSALHESLDAESDLKEMLRWFDAEESSELRANMSIEQLLEESGASFSFSPRLMEVRRAIGILIGKQYEHPRFNERHKFVISSKADKTEFQISQLSQGYQSMLALGMDFARRLGLANEHVAKIPDGTPISDYLKHAVERLNPGDASFLSHKGPAWAPAIMLVDEIDLHLHPSWQQRVLGDLMRAFPGTQFIVTTHSPQVLTTVKRENIRMLGRNPDGAWEALQPPQEIKGVESAVALNEVMGVNPIPPVDEAKWLADYTAKIENGTHADPEGAALREKLLSLYGPAHPVMLDADRLIRFQSFKLSKGTAPEG